MSSALGSSQLLCGTEVHFLCQLTVVSPCTCRKTCIPCALLASLGETSVTWSRSQPSGSTERGLLTGRWKGAGEAEGTGTTNTPAQPWGWPHRHRFSTSQTCSARASTLCQGGRAEKISNDLAQTEGRLFPEWRRRMSAMRCDQCALIVPAKTQVSEQAFCFFQVRDGSHCQEKNVLELAIRLVLICVGETVVVAHYDERWVSSDVRENKPHSLDCACCTDQFFQGFAWNVLWFRPTTNCKL